MSKMFQINEEDLAELERSVPMLLGRCMKSIDDNASRTTMRRVKEILSHVRWNYGPWSDVTEVPAE